MTLATVITAADFGALVEAAFHPEVPVVAASESELGEPLEHFTTPAEVRAKAAACAKAGVHNYSFGLWYPSMKGHIFERKVAIDPPRDGKSFRYSLSGWGIIRLHQYFTWPNTLQCRVVVNSEARARSREARYPELGAVSDWDWRVVETYAFRLSRRLASMGHTAPVVQQLET
ncbi:hypothetical protein E4T66_11295 [Sinimarinibacterium sp. CAU 1509]|uniref:hypothetical protein n=1 Tax=Sinimarinibacterium sp. CAU 1509 TaxID=2562283 RepID=UPI0010ABB05D|nr:hypothetical protein [Sinimarinibacterium sp. CAU 1509]TJY59765.1 hypothetical protein E4T66_11295 [Sinimarinibacterium sp. CAU 1509]